MASTDHQDSQSAPALTYALEPRYYTDPAILAREREEIFFRCWQYACHLSEVAKPGDYVAFNVLDQGLFVIRGRDGELRAFYNVCRHRAHELLRGRGNRLLITCPYHAWAYQTDGKLRQAPNSEKVPGFDTEAICLTPLRLEVFCGFVFVNLDPQARPMAEWYPDVEQELRDFLPAIDDLKPVKDVTVREECNWKVSVENYNECYHCRFAHPTFVKGVIDPDCYNILPQGHCLRHTTQAAPTKNLTYAYDTERSAHASDYSSWYLWPTFSFQVYPGNVLNTYLWHPDGIAATDVVRGWYSVDGENAETVLGLAEQDRVTTVAEDIKLVNAVQRGLSNRGYRPGPLVVDPDKGVNSEHSIEAFYGWLMEALGEST